MLTEVDRITYIDRKKEVIFEKSSDFTSSKEFEELKDLFLKIKSKYGLDSSQLLNKLDKKEIVIPVSIFNKVLSSLESVVKYLRENLELSNKEISIELNRSDKTISQSYTSSKDKHPEKFEVLESKFYIPISILKNRDLSILENLVKYLHEHFGMNYSEIGRKMKRDPRTIWTVYNRSNVKGGGR